MEDILQYGEVTDNHFYLSPNIFLETIFGHKPDDLNYCNDWYPWKDDKKTKAPVNKKNGMDVWVKSSGQKMYFDFLKKKSN